MSERRYLHSTPGYIARNMANCSSDKRVSSVVCRFPVPSGFIYYEWIYIAAVVVLASCEKRMEAETFAQKRILH